jgi:hypothetical protein
LTRKTLECVPPMVGRLTGHTSKLATMAEDRTTVDVVNYKFFLIDCKHGFVKQSLSLRRDGTGGYV